MSYPINYRLSYISLSKYLLAFLDNYFPIPFTQLQLSSLLSIHFSYPHLPFHTLPLSLDPLNYSSVVCSILIPILIFASLYPPYHSYIHYPYHFHRLHYSSVLCPILILVFASLYPGYYSYIYLLKLSLSLSPSQLLFGHMSYGYPTRHISSQHYSCLPIIIHRLPIVIHPNPYPHPCKSYRCP
jgi:general stress protein CsbA